MFDQESRRQIVGIANSQGIDPAALLAVALVESAGTPFWNINGRMEPAIRFEGHYFDRILRAKNPAKLAAARAQGLASPTAGAVKNPPNLQRYALLDRAKAIDVDAAIESVSWGLGQVMGEHWKSFGYSSPRELEAVARSGIAGQVDLMVRFILTNGLKNALNARDWHTFARRYNGPNYAQNGYHTKMRDAYAVFAGNVGTGTFPPAGITSDELDVRDIQLLLKNLGFDPGKIDGDLGPLTAAAIRAFQKHTGLPQTGALDAGTLTKLKTDGRPKIDPAKVNDTEDDLLKKGSQTIKLAKNGRLFGILSMIAGALGFGGTQTNMFDGLGNAVNSVIESAGGGGAEAASTDSFLPLLLKLGASVLSASGGGLWVALAGLGFMVFRNSRAVAARRLEDHQQGFNIKF